MDDERIYEYDELEGYELPFGKHRGKRLANVPLGYLEWVRDNTDSQAARITRLYLGHPWTNIRYRMKTRIRAK